MTFNSMKHFLHHQGFHTGRARSQVLQDAVLRLALYSREPIKWTHYMSEPERKRGLVSFTLISPALDASAEVPVYPCLC